MQRVSVQTQDFDLAAIYSALRPTGAGAIVLFSGLVRDFTGSEAGFFLEHYPGMTEKVLQSLARAAGARFGLLGVEIVHRIGQLAAGDQIVVVGTAAPHRADAFAGAEFLMDRLKTEAPFWKKEGAVWVEAKLSDNERAARWQSETPCLSTTHQPTNTASD